MPIFVASTLLPKNSGLWPVLDAQFLRGGFRSVASAVERLAIDASKMVAGMLVQQVDTNELWQLGSDETTWSLLTAIPKTHTHTPSEVGVAGSSLISELERTTWNGKQDALGFTPYNSTNPSGFTSNLGTVTSVAATLPISSTGGATPTLSIAAATTSAAGTLSAADKTKLDGIASGATAYAHPTGDGNLHVPVTSTTNSGKVLTAGATAGSMSWVTPTTGTVTGVTATAPVASTGGAAPVISMAAATASVNGYMTLTYAAKLDGIAASANNYAHPTGDGNLHVPATSTTNNGKVLMAGSTAGSLSWASVGTGTVTSVTASGAISVATGTTTPVISIVAATTSVPGTMSAADKTKLDGVAASANNYAHPTGDGNLHVLATSTTNSGKVLTAGATAGSLSWAAPVATTANLQINSLGVGTAAAGTAGDIRATGDVTAYYSDRRLKDVVGPIEDALQKVLSLNGVLYRANDLAQSFGYSGVNLQAGLLAQEVEAVLPEVVCAAPFDIGQHEDGTEFSVSGEDYKTLKYERVVPLLVEAIKEQQKLIDALTRRLDGPQCIR